MLWLTGKLCPPAKPRNHAIPLGPDPVLEEVDELIKDLKGKAVCVNHDVRRVIGTILDAWHDEKGLFVSMNINDKHDDTIQLLKKWKTGSMNGLSMGHEGLYIKELGTRHSKMAPYEISLVDEGGVDDSRVVGYGNLVNDWTSQSGISRITKGHKINSMSQETPKPSAEDVLKNKPSEEEAQALNKRARLVTDGALSFPDLISTEPKNASEQEMLAYKAAQYDAFREKYNQGLAASILKNMSVLESAVAESPDEYKNTDIISNVKKLTTMTNSPGFQYIPQLVGLAAHEHGKYTEMKNKHNELLKKFEDLEKTKTVPAPTLDAVANRTQPAPPAMSGQDQIGEILARSYAALDATKSVAITDSRSMASDPSFFNNVMVGSSMTSLMDEFFKN